MQTPTDDLRYPIGKWRRQPTIDAAARAALIDAIAAAPQGLREAVRGLTDRQLDTPYRDGGWTPRQIVHHVADSHMNAYIRFKLGLTEDGPTIKTYEESAWAETVDGRTAPIEISLALIDNLHQRWVQFLRSMDEAAFARAVRHPDHGLMKLDDLLQLYGWHGRHHTAHITALRQRQGW
jgi:uncharacterized damage-inducible protein DinB